MIGKKWYAVYTKPRWEKKVVELLEEKRIENYLPLQKILKQWSDRKKWVREPLFRSYVFVFIDQEEYLSTLQTSGVVKFVTFEGKAVSIPPIQIEAIRTYVETGEDLVTESVEMKVGDKVKVIRGPLKGLEGKLLSISEKKRVRVMIEGIQQSLLLRIPVSYLEIL